MNRKFYITGTRRGLGKVLSNMYETVDNMEDCDVFINCKHDGFEQVRLLYKAARLGKRVVNIGSTAADWTTGSKKKHFLYGIEKKTLSDVNAQLYWEGHPTTIINPGFFDTERSAHCDVPKMPVEYVAGLVDWVLQQPYIIKELTVAPPTK